VAETRHLLFRPIRCVRSRALSFAEIKLSISGFLHQFRPMAAGVASQSQRSREKVFQFSPVSGDDEFFSGFSDSGCVRQSAAGVGSALRLFPLRVLRLRIVKRRVFVFSVCEFSMAVLEPETRNGVRMMKRRLRNEVD